MTGLERNSDIVFAASYAPLLMVSLLCIYYSQNDINIRTIERCQISVDAKPCFIRVSHSKNREDVYRFMFLSASQVYPSTSFYTQQVVIFDGRVKSRPSHLLQLFSVNRGTEYLPSTLPTVGGTLYWSVTRDAPTNTVIIKVLEAHLILPVMTMIILRYQDCKHGLES